MKEVVLFLDRTIILFLSKITYLDTEYWACFGVSQFSVDFLVISILTSKSKGFTVKLLNTPSVEDSREMNSLHFYGCDLRIQLIYLRFLMVYLLWVSAARKI